MTRDSDSVAEPISAGLKHVRGLLVVVAMLGAIITACTATNTGWTAGPPSATAGAVAPSFVAPGPQSFEPAPPTAPASTEPVARDDLFELEMRTGKTRYAAGEPIDASAAIQYLGPGRSITTHGSGSGVVLFSLEHLDGPLDMSGAWTADCGPAEVPADPPEVVIFEKSGGITDDSNAAFWRAYFAEPELRLPAGTWRLWALFDRWTGGSCGAGFREHRLLAAVTIVVQ